MGYPLRIGQKKRELQDKNNQGSFLPTREQMLINVVELILFYNLSLILESIFFKSDIRG